MNFEWLFNDIKIGKYKVSIVSFVWFALSAITVFSEVIRGADSINNYLVYKGVYEHLINQQNLYLAYPKEYFDLNHYGPVFSLLIAPFAIMPLFIGCFLWGMLNAWVLYLAIIKLNFNKRNTLIVLLICTVELMTSLHNVQYNPFIAALIILAFVYVREEKDWLATMCIAFGFLTKLYPIVGIFFFVFSKHKLKFILWGIFWLVLFTLLPLIFTSYHFLYQTHFDWWQSLVDKTNQNVFCSTIGGMQDISVMGLIRRFSKVYDFPSLWVVIPAMFSILLPLLRIKYYHHITYQLLYLSSLLIATVIFSSSAESPTFIIAVAGVAIWWIVQKRPYSLGIIAAFVFAIILTSLSSTDLCPHYVRDHIITPYSLKALPCFIIWCIGIFQLVKIDKIIPRQEINPY